MHPANERRCDIVTSSLAGCIHKMIPEYQDICRHSQDHIWVINTLRLRQNGRHFADDIFKCIFLYDNFWILIEISVKYVPYGLIDNIAALVQIMTWRRTGDKPLSEPMLIYCTGTYMHNSAVTSWYIQHKYLRSKYWCLSARLQYIQSISNGDIAVLHEAIDMILSDLPGVLVVPLKCWRRRHQTVH